MPVIAKPNNANVRNEVWTGFMAASYV